MITQRDSRLSSLQVSSDSNDTLPTAPAQRLDAPIDDNLQPEGEADGQQRLTTSLASTAFSGRGTYSSKNAKKSAANALTAQHAKQPTEKATFQALSRTESPLGHSRKSGAGMALSFVSKRMQQKASLPIDDSLVQGLRRNMREQLLKRLTKSSLGGGSNAMANQSPQVQAAFAKRLEEILFKTSKSVEAYADTQTLDRRLQTLLAAMQKRKANKGDAKPPASSAKAAIQQQQASSQTSSSSVTSGSRRSQVEQQKRDVLRRTMGQDKTNRVFKVVAEIKLIQLGREVTEGKPYEPFPQCTKNGCSFSVPCPGDQKAPKVVRDLFFNTAIITAYEKTSPNQLASLPWDQLLAQGEARLSAYHDWFRQRQAAKSKKPLTSLP